MKASEPQNQQGTATEPDYTPRISPTYLVGVFLAVNAVRDLYLLVEGPDCAHMKTQFVQGNHDWMSTLTSVSGFHRVANTALHPDHMSGSREHSLREALLRLATHQAVPMVAMTSMPLASITGADYGRLVREVAEQTGKEVVHIPGKSLSGDWLDGYAESLLALASQLDLSGAKPSPEKVGVVGNLFDRNEGDHTANVAEIERLLSGLGLEPVSIWLSGRGSCELSAIREAGVIISLPYGRRAARTVARRTGARLVELPLPFGLPATEAWVRKLGELLGREKQAREVLDRELGRVVPKLEWVIPEVLQNLRLGYVGDPHLLPGLSELVALVGASLELAVVTNRATHTRELGASLDGVPLLVNPKQKRFNRFINEHASGGRIDLLIANNTAVGMCDLRVLEFGFPAIFRHSLYERPFLGFGGSLALLDSIANAMRQSWVEQAQQRNMRKQRPPGK